MKTEERERLLFEKEQELYEKYESLIEKEKVLNYLIRVYCRVLHIPSFLGGLVIGALLIALIGIALRVSL